jgi:outer membrane protein OmpA-like peptidoglycan-associated protein
MEMRLATTSLLCLSLLAAFPGCQNGSLWFRGDSSAGGSPATPLTNLDQANEKLHRQLAQTRQLHQATLDELELVKKQLGETADQLRTYVNGESGQQSTAAPTIRSSVNPQRPQVIPISDLVSVADGDSVRYEIPARRLFESGTSRLTDDGHSLLRQVSQVISQHYSRQLIAIEGYSAVDESSADPRELHQQTALWSLAVLEQLVEEGALSEQLFIVAHGSNHPRYSSGSLAGRSSNQRIELVIYPDQLDDGS